MPIARIYQAIPLQVDSTVQLDEAAQHHIARVLRAKIGDGLILFNGEGGEFSGTIKHIDKKSLSVEIKNFFPKNVESDLELYLAQGISRGEKMDFTIQKAVELGVKKIIPLLTERCNVKLDAERRDKRWQHWQSIAISACEQCGRTQVPEVLAPQQLNQFLKNIEADWKFVLAPQATQKLAQNNIAKNAKVVLLIGPEGGLSDDEIKQATQQEFLALNLGPRILRTETAAIAALTALQCQFGDMT